MYKKSRAGRARFACAVTMFALVASQSASATASGTVVPPSVPDLMASSQPAAAGSAGSVGSVGSSGARIVTYNGVRVTVPATWPVVDLRLHPRACVRFDQSAIYLGPPGPESDCPAHAVGRTDTIWLRTISAERRTALTSPSARVGALAARVTVDPIGHERQAQFLAQGVELNATWGAGSASVDQVLASAVPTSAPSTAAAAVSAPIVAEPLSRTATQPSSPAPAASIAAAVSTGPAVAAASAPATASTFTGMAFDTCTAPSTSTMSSWLASPYRSVGIYLGGPMRACVDGNLSAAWVTQVKAMGWGLLPIYVGLQAPCVDQKGLSSFTAANAVDQGTASATDAVSRATLFGLSSGTPIYFNMEAYDRSAVGCSQTVMTFISAWTAELHRLGYTSGVYGSTSSMMTDMSRAITSPTFVSPNNVWFADWNQLQTTSASSVYPVFSDAYWGSHQRAHQYAGNLAQTWGSVGLNIDANWVDATVAGTPVPVSYGPNIVGPGSRGFVFTGSMNFWRPPVPTAPAPPAGLKGLAYWTISSGATEGNGATWSPQLSPGVYTVRASIPTTDAPASTLYATSVPYTVKDALATKTVRVNQRSVKGYTSLGTYTARAGSPISVHVGDNDAGSTITQIGVDAMSFSLATAPGSPGAVSAVGGNGQAVVSWTAAAANGSPVTGYTVTASPGGRTATATGVARTTTVVGLTGGTAYTFTVRATNAAGSGPSSAPSTAVTPAAAVTRLSDFNRDGSTDLVTRDSAGRLWLYPGSGTGGFGTRRLMGSGGWNAMTALVTPGDVTGDGNADVLARDTAGVLWLYPGNGAGALSARRKMGSGWGGFTVTGAADLNHAGRPDLLARDSTGALWLYPISGNAIFGTRTRIGTGWAGYTILGAGDVSGDGRADILARDSAGSLWLYRGNGAGGVTARSLVSAGWQGAKALVTPGNWDRKVGNDMLARDSAGRLWAYPGNNAGHLGARRLIGASGWNAMTYLG